MTAILEDVSSETYDKWGTLNTAVSPAKLEKNHTPRAINVWPDEKPGSIVTVEGWTHIGDLPSGNPCRFLFTFEKSDGTSMVLCSDNATVYKTVDFITFTSIITGLSSAFQLRAATVRDKVWLTNGNDSVRTYDGTSVVVLDGTSSNPDVPKGKLIEFWDERVWLGDNPSARSSLRFSALVDSSGSDIAPDNASAWPSSNEIACGKADGDVICGLKVYKGVLFPFKAKSIYRIDGQDEFTYAPTKTSATTGSRMQESIQERDNILEFIGKDGIYEFDGANAQKASDVIDSVDLTQFSFQSIQQSNTQAKSRLWTTGTDFAACTLTKVTSTRDDGAVIVDNYTYAGVVLPGSDTPAWTRNTIFSESVSSGILSLSCQSGVTVPTLNGGASYQRTETGLSNTNGTRLSMRCKLITSDTNDRMFMRIYDGTREVDVQIFPTIIYVSDGGGTLFTYTHTATDDYHTYDVTLQGNNVALYVDGSSVGTSSSDTTSVTFQQIVQWGILNHGAVGAARVSTASYDFFSVIFCTTSTPQIISDVYHITDTISSWGAFQASYINNSGSVAFYFRSGTSSVNCLAASWVAISPGATISVSVSNVYVQWRADLTVSGVNSPEIDDVTVNWNTGNAGTGTTQNVATIVFKSRYWLAGALIGSTYNNTVIVRGKRVFGGPFVRLSQFNITAFCIFNNQLYAAASDSDDINQLDQGTSANGSALESYWETRDEVGGQDEIFNKRWPVIVIVGQRKGNYNLTVDVSIDGGTTYPSAYQKTISLAGSGRFKTELRYESLRSEKIRVRLRTNGIDQPFDVASIQVFWRKALLR